MKIARSCIEKRLNKPFKSNRKFKKFQVCVKDKLGNIKNIHFGDNRYEDFTQHKDEKRRVSFRKRHRCDSDRPSKLSARYWSCEELW